MKLYDIQETSEIIFQTSITRKYATLEDMDEADEFCIGKGYDGVADKLTRQEFNDLHTQWKGTLYVRFPRRRVVLGFLLHSFPL